jgi:hypothetical protein
VTGDSLAWAREYCRRGWQVVPIPAGQKRPRIAGWQVRRLGLDDLEQHFEAECNVGVRSGGLGDSDLWRRPFIRRPEAIGLKRDLLHRSAHEVDGQ